jgi:plasmid stabilization system protein ParE
VRALPVERHMIYYRLAGDEIVILALLHERQDRQLQFSKDSDEDTSI